MGFEKASKNSNSVSAHFCGASIRIVVIHKPLEIWLLLKEFFTLWNRISPNHADESVSPNPKVTVANPGYLGWG